MSNRIVYGDTVNIDITAVSRNKSVYFTVTLPSVAPTAGALYRDSDGVLYTVSQYSSLVLYTTSNSDTNPRNSSGTLTKISGTGDATITYSAYESNNIIDLTGSTIYLYVKKKVTDTNAQAVYNTSISSHVYATKGLSRWSISVADWASFSNFLPGHYVLIAQIITAASTEHTFTPDSLEVVKFLP